MYFRRLKVFLALIGVVLAAWLGRLAYLQIVMGQEYRRLAEQELIGPVHSIPTERGRILDRYDRLLAHDIPPSAVAVDYRILAGDLKYLARKAGRLRPRMTQAELEEAARPAGEQYERLLRRLAEVCQVPWDDFQHRRLQVVAQVAAIKESVSRRQGRPTAVPEERTGHVMISDISPKAADQVIGLIGQVEGIELTSQLRRHYVWGECMAHLVGTEGPVSREDLEADPFSDDPRRRYLPDDRRGISGVERLAEATLRGWRGLRQFDLAGQTVQRTEPVRGGNVRLSIDAYLQQQVYRVLARHVRASRYPCGGAVVVINIGDRSVLGEEVRDGEILALVSFPGFDANRWQDDYARLLADAHHQPLLFRAIAGVYPPGSIVKPAVLALALRDRKLGLGETIDCPGWLISPTYQAFRCWRKYGHGPLTASHALKFSCNVFFYRLGERLRLPDLCRGLQQFGLGRGDLTGLADERGGHVPTPLWLATNRPGFRGFSPADARNVAIGQGDLGVTPLEAANLMAAVARGGIYRAPILLAGQRVGQPAQSLGLDWAAADLIRQGLKDAVNAEGGTAYKYARMSTTLLAGKTGSAQASRRRINGQLFPPSHDADGEPLRPSHAWFTGYAPADRPAVAVACLIEYGMKGGEAAGPLARDVVQVCINLGYVPGGEWREVEGAVEPPDPTTATAEDTP